VSCGTSGSRHHFAWWFSSVNPIRSTPLRGPERLQNFTHGGRGAAPAGPMRIGPSTRSRGGRRSWSSSTSWWSARGLARSRSGPRPTAARSPSWGAHWSLDVGGIQIRCRDLVPATGSVPILPPIVGLQSITPWTSALPHRALPPPSPPHVGRQPSASRARPSSRWDSGTGDKLITKPECPFGGCLAETAECVPDAGNVRDPTDEIRSARNVAAHQAVEPMRRPSRDR
jgi:hypothetical protein